MKLRIWTLLAAFIIVATFGLVLPTVLTNKQASVAVNYQQVKDDFKSELIQSLAALNYAEPGATVKAGETAPATTAIGDGTLQTATTTGDTNVAATIGKDTTKAAVAPGAAASGTAPAGQASTNDVASAATIDVTNGPVPLGNSNSFVKDGWINEKINENKDKISENDLDRGARIYNGLDTDYLFSLSDGGLTDEERAQVDAYLSKSLSGADYQLAKELYYKYVGLLSND